MEIVFEKDYLRELYYDGKTSDKQHRYQPHILKKYVNVVNILDAVTKIGDLFRYNSCIMRNCMVTRKDWNRLG